MLVPVKPGETKTGLTGKRGEEQHFSIEVPQGATHLRFVQSGGTGDAAFCGASSDSANAFRVRSRPEIARPVITVAAPITALMPGAGPPDTRMASFR